MAYGPKLAAIAFKPPWVGGKPLKFPRIGVEVESPCVKEQAAVSSNHQIVMRPSYRTVYSDAEAHDQPLVCTVFIHLTTIEVVPLHAMRSGPSRGSVSLVLCV